jgi:hypothetical protein
MKLPRRPASKPSGTSGAIKSVIWKKRLAFAPAIQPHGKQHPEKTTVERHAAFPHLENIQRIGQIVTEFVEQHIPETATENHPQHTIKQQIVELLRIQQRCRAALDTVMSECEKQRKGQQIHQPVPANGQRPERDGNRIKLRMNHHDARPKPKKRKRHYTQSRMTA